MAWVKALGLTDMLALLKENEQDEKEKAAGKKLSELAESGSEPGRGSGQEETEAAMVGRRR